MLYKAVAIILSALFIALVQASTASAGGCHGGFGHGFGRLAFHQFQSTRSESYALRKARERRAAEARAAAAAKAERRAAAIRSAKAEKKAEASKVAAADPAPKAETSNVAAETTSSDAKVKVADAGQTCTKFVAEVGTTVTTDCASK